jgi:hypothetical protein
MSSQRRSDAVGARRRAAGDNVTMRYRRAVEKLRELADACQWTTRLPVEEPFLCEGYVFGEILDGVDPIERIQVALTLNMTPEEVPWCSQPRGTAWLVDSLRLDKGGFAVWWRSRHGPVWNHVIHEPVRFWSLDGTDEAVLDALRDRRFADLPRLTASPAELRRHTEVELDRALAQLRAVNEKYWDRDWRNEHRGGGHYPEDHLWEAAHGYLDLLDAVHRLDAETSGTNR